MKASPLAIAALSALLGYELGELARYQKTRAEKLYAAIVRWYGPHAVERLIFGAVKVRLFIRRHDWKTLAGTSESEREAVKLGAVSRSNPAYAHLGRYRPSLYVLPVRKGQL